MARTLPRMIAVDSGSPERRRALPLLLSASAPALLLTFAVWWPFLRSATVDNRYHDWTFRADYAGYAVDALFERHAMPYWATLNTYQQLRAKGNHGFFSNPETEVLSPFLILYKALSFVTAARVAVAIHLVVGVLGTSLLCIRSFGLREPPAVWAITLLLLSSGFFTQHVLAGHLQFASYAYLPMAFHWYLRASELHPFRRRLLHAAGAAGLLALSLYEGNVHLLLHFFMFLSCHALLSSLLVWKRARGTTISFALVLALFASLAAYKLIPMVIEYGHFKNDYRIAYQSLDDLRIALLEREFRKVSKLDHEQALYLGPIGLALIAFGYLWPRRTTLPFAVAGLLFLWLCFDPYPETLAQLPLLKTQGALTRFRGVFLFASACLLACTLRASFDWLRASSRRLPLAAARIALAIASLYMGYDFFRSVDAHVSEFSVSPIDLPKATLQAPALQAAWERVPPGPSMDAGAARVERTQVNSFTYVYEGKASPTSPVLLSSAELTIATMGTQKLRLQGSGSLTELHGQVAVRVTHSPARFRLRYMPSYLLYGAATSLVTLVGLLAYVVYTRPRRGRGSLGELGEA